MLNYMPIGLQQYLGLRYQPKGTISKDKAEQIQNAERDKPNGVLKWIMKYW